MKGREKIKRLLAVMIAVCCMPHIAMPMASAESEGYLLYDFSDAGFCDETINNLEYEDCDRIQNVLYGNTGIYIRNNANFPAPRLTFDLTVDSDKYKYAKVCVSYATLVADGDKNPMTTWVAVEGAKKSKLADIAGDGKSMTEAGGKTYAAADFKASGTSVKFITLMTELDTAGEESGSVSGEKKFVYCPAESSNGDNVKCNSILKYIAFFETKESAEKFDTSVMGVSYTVGEEKYDAEIDPLTCTAKIALPDGAVNSDNVDFSQISFILQAKTLRATLKDSDKDKMTAVYNVTTLTGGTSEWTVELSCKNVDDNYIKKMIDDLNSMKASNAEEIWEEYDYAIGKLVDGYSDIDASLKGEIVKGMIGHAGKITVDNYKDIIKDEMLYSQIKNLASYKDFSEFAKNQNIKDENWNESWFDDLNDTQKERVFNEAVICSSYPDFCNTMWEKSVVTAISAQESYGGIRDIFERNLELFGYSEAEYEKIVDEVEFINKAYMQLEGKTFDTADEFIKAFADAVKDLGGKVDTKTPKPSKDKGSSSGEIIHNTDDSDKHSFNDISEYTWAIDDIEALYKEGIINGKGNGKFAPGDSITREEFVKIAVNAFGLEDAENDGKFIDVLDGSWYTDYVYSAYSAGAVNGMSENEFGVGGLITREDMATISYRILKLLEADYETDGDISYDDSDEISDYAKEAVEVLSINKVLNGSGGKFLPKNTATRAEATCIIRRLTKLIKGEEITAPVVKPITDENEDATQQMKALYSLGIYNEAALGKRRDFVDREAFAEIAVNFANIGGATVEGNYSDLRDGNFAATAVAYELMDDGIGGRFDAKKIIVREDAIRLLTKSILDTSDVRELGGYVNAAKLLNIENDFANGEQLTYAMLANMLIDSLQTEVPQKRGDIAKDDRTYINNAFDAKIMTGTLTATDRTSIYGADGVRKGCVSVGNVEYETDIELNDRLGTDIKYIVSEDDDSKIIYVYDNYARYNEYIADASDIYDFNGTNYRIDKKGKLSDFRVSREKILIYNGINCTDYTYSMFKPKLGTVRLVDNNRDGSYDIIFVNEYKTMIVKTVDTQEEAIYDKNGAGKVSYRNADTFIVEKNGKSTYVNTLLTDDVLQVYQSKGGEYLKVVACDETISGTLQTINKEDELITVDGEDYSYDVEYVESYSGNLPTYQSATLSLNYDGKIVYVAYTTSDMKFGYLIDAEIVDSEEGEEIIKLKMFVPEEKRVKNLFSVTGKMTIDNERKKLADVMNILKKGSGGKKEVYDADLDDYIMVDTGEVMSQAILYNTNDSGSVNKIDTAYNNVPKQYDSKPLLDRKPGNEESADSFRVVYATDLLEPDDKESMWAKRQNNLLTFGRNRLRLLVDLSAYILVVPTNPKAAAPEDFMQVSSTYFKDQTYTNKMEAYSYTSSEIANALIFHEDSSSFSEKPTSLYIRVVTGMETKLNDDGELVTVLQTHGCGYGSNEVFATDEIDLTQVESLSYNDAEGRYKIAVGDIIWYDLNSRNEITNIRIIFDASETDPIKAFKAHHREDMIRMWNSILEDRTMWLMDVYSVDSSGLAKCTFTDLTTCDPDDIPKLNFAYENLPSFDGQFFVHLDLTQGKPVVTFNDASGAFRTSWKDVKDYKTYGNGRSLIMPVTRNGYVEGMFLIDMPRGIE